MEVDKLLLPHAAHLAYRWQKFTQLKAAIEANEGGLAAFARGYEKYGGVREGGATVFREWAPGAAAVSLIGDFNGWNDGAHRMSRNEFGVWTVAVPDRPDGSPGVPHRSKIKLRLWRHGGGPVDRLSAWVRWATAEQGKLGALYDGVFWSPPEAEKHKWKNSAPPRPAAPRIYEAHVGMAGIEPRVHTYREFSEKVLPRIAALGAPRPGGWAGGRTASVWGRGRRWGPCKGRGGGGEGACRSWLRHLAKIPPPVFPLAPFPRLQHSAADGDPGAPLLRLIRLPRHG